MVREWGGNLDWPSLPHDIPCKAWDASSLLSKSFLPKNMQFIHPGGCSAQRKGVLQEKDLIGMGLNSLIHWYFATESHLFSIAVLRKAHLQCSPHLFGSRREPVPRCLLKTCTGLIFKASISELFVMFWSWKQMQEESKRASVLVQEGM